MAKTEQCWEYADDGFWTRYADDVQTRIRAAFEAKLPTVEVTAFHILNFSEWRQIHKGDCKKWRGVRMLMVAVTDPDEKPAIIQSEKPSADDEQVTQGCTFPWLWQCCEMPRREPTEPEPQWEFMADGEVWQAYPVEVNRRINEAHRAGQAQVEVTANHHINFGQEKQINKSDNSRWRKVRVHL